MIPKIIHYCWFGKNPLPEDTKHYINTWRQYCPDYEIIEWNESNFDINSNQYTKEAYENKKWAFVTDYVRLFVLYNYGGIYMDTDVEVLKPLDSFLNQKGFSGFERKEAVPTGIMASEANHPFIKQLLDLYINKHFIDSDGKQDLTTNVELITNISLKLGLIPNNQLQIIEDFAFYPTSFFCPKNSRTFELLITPETYTIHHFDGSWNPKRRGLRYKIKKTLGPRGSKVLIKLMDLLHIK